MTRRPLHTVMTVSDAADDTFAYYLVDAADVWQVRHGGRFAGFIAQTDMNWYEVHAAPNTWWHKEATIEDCTKITQVTFRDAVAGIHQALEVLHTHHNQVANND